MGVGYKGNLGWSILGRDTDLMCGSQLGGWDRELMWYGQLGVGYKDKVGWPVGGGIQR